MTARATIASSVLVVAVGCAGTPPPTTTPVEIITRVCDENAPDDECIEVEAHIDFDEDEPATVTSRICDEPPKGITLPPAERFEEDCVVVSTEVERTRVPLAGRVGRIFLGIARFIGAIINAVIPG